MTYSERRCGSVAIIGAPNAGKSTLVNQIVGSKVSIVSPKVQTTRNRVLGINIHENSQIILIDTPGLFSPQSRLDKAMVTAAWGGAAEGDMVAYIYDSKKKSVTHNDKQALTNLAEIAKEARVFLVLNKVDVIDKPKLLSLATELNTLCPFQDTFMISAYTGDGVADVTRYIAKHIPVGEWAYDEDDITDMPMRLLAAEITREQIFNQLHQEIPYAITVDTEQWEEFDNGDVRLQQIIHVEKDQQKAIVLGKGGSRLKEIGARARAELQTIFDRPVHLKLFVRVTDKWKDDPLYYAQWGLHEKS
jgi:GTP-binding protein Era